MCTEEGRRLGTLIILVSKSSDSCQSSGEEKPWELGEGRAPHLYRLVHTSQQSIWVHEFLSIPLGHCASIVSNTEPSHPSPQNLAVISVIVNFLKITLSSPNLLGQLFSAWLAGSPLGIDLGCWASCVSKLKWVVGVIYLSRFAGNFLGFSTDSPMSMASHQSWVSWDTIRPLLPGSSVLLLLLKSEGHKVAGAVSMEQRPQCSLRMKPR